MCDSVCCPPTAFYSCRLCLPPPTSAASRQPKPARRLRLSDQLHPSHNVRWMARPVFAVPLVSGPCGLMLCCPLGPGPTPLAVRPRAVCFVCGLHLRPRRPAPRPGPFRPANPGRPFKSAPPPGTRQAAGRRVVDVVWVRGTQTNKP